MSELNDWFNNSAKRARVITKCYPGQTIYMATSHYKDQDSGKTKYIRKQYVIDAVYPWFVLCHAIPKDRHALSETFNLGDLVINGYEPGIFYESDYVKMIRNR